MPLGTESGSRGMFRLPSKQPTDGKKKSVPDGSTASQTDVEALVEFQPASSNQSVGDHRSTSFQMNSKSPPPRPPRTNSKSPGKRTSGKVQPIVISPAHNENNTNDPIENLSILRSQTPGSPRLKAKHVAFDDSPNVDIYKACSKCNNRHYSGYRMPWRTVSVEELKIATDDYSLDNGIKLHDDIFLFKGNLDGQPVYVDRKGSDEMQLSLLSEVDILTNLRHPNIISLRAFCADINNQALVFSFVCSRNLFFHLSPKNLNPVQWPKRVNLAIELAKGLVYLHHDRSIIHGNINSLTVHVTCDFVPVIGDFSFSTRSAVGREFILQDRSTHKKARGYLAPEYQRRGEGSEKQDIYAFGVILIELISGLPPFNRKRQIPFLGEWGRTMIEELELDPLRLVGKIVDPRLSMDCEFTSLLQMIRVAKQCLQEDPSQRPPMTEVLESLKPCAV